MSFDLLLIPYAFFIVILYFLWRLPVELVWRLNWRIILLFYMALNLFSLGWTVVIATSWLRTPSDRETEVIITLVFFFVSCALLGGIFKCARDLLIGSRWYEGVCSTAYYIHNTRSLPSCVLFLGDTAQSPKMVEIPYSTFRGFANGKRPYRENPLQVPYPLRVEYLPTLLIALRISDCSEHLPSEHPSFQLGSNV